jgi:hypothetical protein
MLGQSVLLAACECRCPGMHGLMSRPTAAVGRASSLNISGRSVALTLHPCKVKSVWMCITVRSMGPNQVHGCCSVASLRRDLGQAVQQQVRLTQQICSLCNQLQLSVADCDPQFHDMLWGGVHRLRQSCVSCVVSWWTPGLSHRPNHSQVHKCAHHTEALGVDTLLSVKVPTLTI